MMKRMRLYGVAVMLLVLLAGLQAGATGQIPEKIHYKGGTLSMSSKPLETFFTKDNPRPDSFEFYHLAQKDSVTLYRMAASSSACYRGYVGTWKVDEGALWLISLETVTKEQIPLSAFNKDWI